jgi:hypothetical protein
MKGLQLLQLQSNRITKIPIIPRLDDIIHGQSTFVTDCGVPSAFDNALECDNCTMCCKYYSAAVIVYFDSFSSYTYFLLTSHQIIRQYKRRLPSSRKNIRSEVGPERLRHFCSLNLLHCVVLHGSLPSVHNCQGQEYWKLSNVGNGDEY